MASVVLNIQTRGILQENDLIVYDKKKKFWKVVQKGVFLEEIRKEIEDLSKKIDEFNEKVNKNEENIQTMAKILRGEIE